MTNIETTEENIDGLNNAFRNVPYLSAPRLSYITERHPTSLCKETLNYFHDNEIEEDRDSAFDDFMSPKNTSALSKRSHLNNSAAFLSLLIKMAYANVVNVVDIIILEKL